jgi:negative regulator of flagellin synthesis FlgM
MADRAIKKTGLLLLEPTMAIDINKLNTATRTRVHTDAATKNTAQANEAKAATAGTVHKHDSVVITSQAQQLQGVQSKMASLPEIDQKKVAEIKQAIAEGRYKIDPEKLAANIASFEQELNELNKE